MSPWNDRIQKNFRWAKIQGKLDDLLFELYQAEDDEEAGLYLVQLHLDNKTDLEFFPPEELERVKKLLGQLRKDTAKHQNLLSKITAEIEQKVKKAREQPCQ